MGARSSHRRGKIFAPAVVAVALVVAGAAFGQAAAQSTPEASAPKASAPIRIVWPAPDATVVGRDVTVSWQTPGLTIVPAAQADDPNDLHVHFIVDSAAEVVEGAPMAQDCGVLHTAANPATLLNLPPGEHTVTLVVGNPGHIPIEGLERPSVSFTVEENPDAIRITSPENCAEVAGPDVEIAWEAPGLTIVPAAEAASETDYHAHFIVDNAYQVVAGEPIPVQDGVMHTAANPATIEGLAPGMHTVQLVIGNSGHIPIAGLARPTLTVIVGEAGMTATPASAATPAESAQSAETVQIESYDIYFEPEEVMIPADTDVTFSLPNAGAALHNFSIDALGIDVDLAPGATEEVVINAPAGTYEYYCNIPGHKAAGMAGTLMVH